jgi:ribosome-binding factor A
MALSISGNDLFDGCQFLFPPLYSVRKNISRVVALAIAIKDGTIDVLTNRVDLIYDLLRATLYLSCRC